MARRLDIHVEPATAEHARAIASRMSLEGLGDRSAQEREQIALKHVHESASSWCWLHGSRPVALAGVLPRSLLGGVGAVWLLTAPEAFTNVRAFWLASKAVIAHLSHDYHRLEGHVDVEFTASHRWLKRLGFRVLDARVPFAGRLWFPFEKER